MYLQIAGTREKGRGARVQLAGERVEGRRTWMEVVDKMKKGGQ